MTTIELLPEAIAEVRRARKWYLERSPSAERSFCRDLRRAFQSIRQAPRAYRIDRYGVRRCVLRRFPYMVVYRENAGEICVIAIAHGKRRPGYWKTRLPDS